MNLDHLPRFWRKLLAQLPEKYNGRCLVLYHDDPVWYMKDFVALEAQGAVAYRPVDVDGNTGEVVRLSFRVDEEVPFSGRQIFVLTEGDSTPEVEFSEAWNRVRSVLTAWCYVEDVLTSPAVVLSVDEVREALDIYPTLFLSTYAVNSLNKLINSKL